MKNCVIFFNCHGGQIYKQLYSSKIFINQYKVDFISLYDYLEGYKYSNEKDLIQEHLTLIKEADLIILQYIKINKKKIISHEYINSLLKKETKIILIPHYTFSGYNYPYDIFNDEFISGGKDKKELESYINNLFINDKDKIITHINNELENIKYLDTLSDVKCYEFVKYNYNKQQLFYSRSYPTYILFNYISQQILYLIGMNDILKPIWTSYANHTLEPIYPQVKNFLNIEFNIKFNYECNLLEYIICCKKNNVNNLLLINKKIGKSHTNDILNIIKSNKFR